MTLPNQENETIVWEEQLTEHLQYSSDNMHYNDTFLPIVHILAYNTI